MTHRRPPALLPCLVVGLLLACGDGRGQGNLTASWFGSDTGKVSGRPAAVWCRDERRLEMTLVQADLGIGLVLYPAESLTAGTFPFFDPGADTIIRPAAAAAIRWFTEQAIEGYQTDSGGLELTQNGGRYSGSFGFRLHSLDRAKLVRLTGTLDGVTPGPCPSDSLPAPGPATAE